IAQHIAGAGKKATILTRYDREHVGGTVGFFTRNSLFQLLDGMNVEIRDSVNYREVVDDGVIVETADGDEELVAGACVVLATGFKVDLDRSDKWQGCAEEVYLVGNCIDPANIMGITRQANTAAYKIGA
ncbi:MAG: hypothetical protein QF609_04470, partial [Gammaproteobacteria bacterium]|nr:hypothetical protein [Gammaproteobacteria bacterium]